jgi:predicted RNA-binding protein with PIN domain
MVTPSIDAPQAVAHRCVRAQILPYNAFMALLIDGYNLLNVTDIFAVPGPSTELHRSRMALLEFLSAAIDQRQRRETKIVFDAAGAPPGLPHTLTHDGMTIHFARRHSDADELIDELLDQCAAPRSLLVVSSDHRVQRSARRHGADFVDSDKWFAELRAARQSRDFSDEDIRSKPDIESLIDEANYWIEQFADSPPDDSPMNPFPPNYADDVQEEK